ncbi:L-serine ammonia-lyase, iron-sulfur-dependent subunit beta [Thermanaeromonas sp. C210]|uniref:L-serine ammonia-lyase, iron-sulfur-dependent subunit beta n=1 Tax=Thermanaeromonas sp. C210 TaxID=2731925 RepID=UPI00155CA489|nr:L-serine ammonia-lyase, iron-sulfur-dependent subunit beta [Thermanaeromonas sp. C210]GFN22339.1 L-serine dehydratase, iron-sulfur-dependent subunit beta [Thermanaeromonas sp. C210]
MDVFQVIGPVMIGPSSSHTAGAVRLGRLARAILADEPREAEFLLHGSFARTYRGHGTDRALVAGLLGFEVDDERVRRALELAQERGLKVSFKEGDLGEVHPNSVLMIIKGGSRRVEVLGSSLGGAQVVVTRIDGFAVEVTGQLPTLVAAYKDRPGVVAEVTALLADRRINIANMRVSREGLGRRALMIVETDEALLPEIVADMRSWPVMERVITIDPV